MAPVSEEGTRGAETRSCGPVLESRQAEEAAAAGAAVDPEQVFRNRRDQVRAYASGRTPGGRRRDRGGPRDVAAVDAGRRVVEPAAKENEAPPAQRWQGPFGGTGEVGRQVS